MKKAVVMVLLTAGAVFTSCNKDDDTTKQNPIINVKEDSIINVKQDSLIGSWSIIESSTIENGKTTKDELTDCDKKGNLVFLADGNYTSTSYYLDNEECKLDADTKGTWKNLGNSVYQFEWDDETEKGEVIFSGDTFSTSSKDDDDNDITYVVVYKKVK